MWNNSNNCNTIIFLKCDSLSEWDSLKNKQILFNSCEVHGLRMRLTVTSGVLLRFLFNKVKKLSLNDLYVGQRKLFLLGK